MSMSSHSQKAGKWLQLQHCGGRCTNPPHWFRDGFLLFTSMAFFTPVVLSVQDVYILITERVVSGL